jgi:hypothetical protein
VAPYRADLQGYLLHFSHMAGFRAFQALVLAQRRRGRIGHVGTAE